MAAFTLRRIITYTLGLPSTLIRHENGAELFQTFTARISFKISALGLFLKFRKFQPRFNK